VSQGVVSLGLVWLVFIYLVHDGLLVLVLFLDWFKLFYYSFVMVIHLFMLVCEYFTWFMTGQRYKSKNDRGSNWPVEIMTI
jgi:hypothetical protein